MNKVGIRILLKYGQFFQAVVGEDEARKWIDDLRLGSLPSTIGGIVNEGYGFNGWALRSEDIVAIHTNPIDSAVTPPQTIPFHPQGQMPPVRFGRSGI